MKKTSNITVKFLLILMLFPLISVNTSHVAEASSGKLRSGSIVSRNGTYYGQHGNDDHWHEAILHSSGWYPVGPRQGFTSLDEAIRYNNSQVGWSREGGNWYYYNSYGRVETGWTRVGSTWYYMNNSGAMQTGWTRVGSTWYYMNSSGAMQTGWTRVGSTWYYLNSSGAMQTGWTRVGSTWYYLNNSGAMQTGWTRVGGTWYYMNNSGAMQTGWTRVGGTWYYMNNSGAMQTGWQKINGSWYYFTNSGAMNKKTGWNSIGKNWYYQSSSGAMDTGWKKVGNTWYYMKSNAIMQTGWTRVGNTWYYMNNSGAMQTGWQKLNSQWYYMNNSGAMQTGWTNVNNKTYYMNSSGVMQTGQVTIGGILYQFNSSGELEKEISDGATEVPDTVPGPIENMDDAVVVNNNVPWFTNEDLSSTGVYHLNGKLDIFGRVTAANAVVGIEIMPSEERGNIGHHEPTGWIQRRYVNIGSGGWLYNRSHLIGHQMTGNDNFNNLMTGTRWFNMRMVEYENWVANYVEETENHVRYRITPIFEGDNLLASGIYMEGYSIEDLGEGVMFNIFVPNIQPGVEIDYKDGSSVGPEGPATYDDIVSAFTSEEEALDYIFSINYTV